MSRIFFVAIALLAAVSCVSAQDQLQFQAFYNTTSCNVSAPVTGMTPRQSEVFNFTAGSGPNVCNQITFGDDSKLYVQVVCNNATGMITVTSFDEATCTNVTKENNVTDIHMTMNNACNNLTSAGHSFKYWGCNVVQQPATPTPTVAATPTPTANPNNTATATPTPTANPNNTATPTPTMAPTQPSNATKAPTQPPKGTAAQTVLSMGAAAVAVIVALF